MGTASRRWRTAALGASAALLVTGCGGGGKAAAVAPDTSATPTASTVNFVDPLSGGNKWLPLKAGTQWVREGTTMVGKRSVTHTVISTVTDVVREIDGVKAVAVLDEERGGGDTTDKSIDWLAQDADGNIWWVGAITETFKAGKSTGLDEAWTVGRGKAVRGLLVPADPASHSEVWDMAKPPDDKPDRAKFLRMQDKECVPFGCYNNVVLISEGVGSDEVEDKYYASGVGQIRNAPEKSHDEDVEKLANLTMLSAQGLTEASTEALRLDGLAVQEEPAAYGDVKATRAST